MSVRPLRVLLVEPGASWATSDVCEGLRHGLEQHKVEVIRYRLDNRLERSRRWLHYNWRKVKKTQPDFEKPTTADVYYKASAEAIERALLFEVDVVLIVSAMFFHPRVIQMLKRANQRVLVLFTESPYDARELGIASMVDGCWTTERAAVKTFGYANERSGYIRHGWHPERHRPGLQPGDEKVAAHDVVFVGTGFPERIQWLSQIDWRGIDFGLYGSWEGLGANHQLKPYVRGGILDNVATAALYRRAKVGLNLYRTSGGIGPKVRHVSHAESLNPRAYELARCGAFHLSTYRPEVAEVFGDLVPTFETPNEASALIRQWLADDEGRARVSAQLPACVDDASWTHRAAQMLEDMRLLLPLAAEERRPSLVAVGA